MRTARTLLAALALLAAAACGTADPTGPGAPSGTAAAHDNQGALGSGARTQEPVPPLPAA
ncbi:MAG TPA: hypothetical protein VFE05_08585 [Longimicrobiaceae bacterium]|jgi:hypothetical protein|nr:hypothetical protein [Longimicrobiaceae bacterium]